MTLSLCPTREQTARRAHAAQAVEARRRRSAELAAHLARVRALAHEARSRLERHRGAGVTHADVARLLRACAVPPRIVAREAFQAPLADDAMPGDCV